MIETITKIIARTKVDITPVKNAPVTVPNIPPVIIYSEIFKSIFFLWLIAAISEENGITNRFIPNVLSKGNPAA